MNVTPDPPLPEITLRVAVVVDEPIRVLDALITRIPSVVLGIATFPLTLVPITFPSITLLEAATPLIVIPVFAFPEITFRKATELPPI